MLSGADAWILDANLTEAALAYLFCHAENKPIWVDPVSTIKAQRLIPYLSKIHCLTPNLDEAQLLSGVQVEDFTNAPLLAKKLHDKGVNNVMITSGERGAYASDGNTAFCLEAETLSVKNVTGCGDAAIAALVHGSITGLDWKESGKLAMSAAALTASSEQTNSPLLSTLGTNV